MDIVYFSIFLTSNQRLKSIFPVLTINDCSDMIVMFEEHNFTVSCSAEKVRRQRERGQTGKRSVNSVGGWQEGKIYCTCTEMWKVRRRKIAPHSCDSDRDKPSSHQTRRLYSGAGGMRPATSELPVEGNIRLVLLFFLPYWRSNRVGFKIISSNKKKQNNDIKQHGAPPLSQI